MYGPYVAILLRYASHDTRRVDFRGLTSSQRTPRVWGVTEIYRFFSSCIFYMFLVSDFQVKLWKMLDDG